MIDLTDLRLANLERPVPPARFIGRCRRKGCTYRKAADVPRIWVRKVDHRYGSEWMGTAYAAPDGRPGGTPRAYDYWLWKLDCPDPGHAGSTRWTLVEGTVTDTACNAKCMGAVGPSCECSCGGANHGGRYL